MVSRKVQGVTIIELTVVILILSVLASIAATVYTGYLTRAKFAVARTDISQLEMAATQYKVDLGVYPPSSSGSAYGSSAAAPVLHPVWNCTYGCGYLMLTLIHSYSGDATNPAAARWAGPYLSVNLEKFGHYRTGQGLSSSTPIPEICLLDPWGRPYFYIRNNDYPRLGGTEMSDTPFVEPFYNPSTVQIFSLGPDGQTEDQPEAGLGKDDINNFNTRTEEF